MMNAKECLEMLRTIKDAAFATVDEKGEPHVRIIDVMLIDEECIACGTCKSVCPQRCIDEGDIYFINQEHCLHCGNCFENCPVSAIKAARSFNMPHITIEGWL